MVGTNNVLVPQLLGRSFQKARNFTASSHQNAGSTSEFSKKNPGVTQTLTTGGATPSRTQHPARPMAGAGRKRPGVGTHTLVPLNFSAVVVPLLRQYGRLPSHAYNHTRFNGRRRHCSTADWQTSRTDADVVA